MTDQKIDMLDDLFAQARNTAPPASDDLMARVLADAALTQPKPQAVVVARDGFFTRLLNSLGGWSAIGGLTTATIVGFWIGAAPPAVLDDMAAGLSGDVVSFNLFGATEFDFEEGLADG